ncbi:MAG: sigma-70 family RNA polymerase sigma factor [Myxococcales bacterium]|nr:sigma-70 family RNA polymerase sigma factor [Myxococcales bacterium]
MPTLPAELDAFRLAAAARGDARARRAFIEVYADRVHALAHRMLAPRGLHGLVDDVAQETFLAALGALGGFRPDGAARLSTWVLTIASRRALDAIRAEERRARREALVAPTHAAASPESTVAGRRLAELVGALPVDQHAVFVLRAFHEFSLEEIADALDLPLGTVKSRLARARAELRQALGEVAP